tara:strand:- start:14293 stop:15003 length:711 start_codon:yes stop_codon:yes gene_type:complete
MTTQHIDSVERIGFGIVSSLLPDDLRQDVLALFDGDPGRVGRRDGLAFEAVRAAATSDAIRGVVDNILGRGAFATKATLFDKTPASNWLVPWHQDVTIAVRTRRETEGFDAWSTKGGVAHVRPPLEVLESMVAVRLDLDGTTELNGPLRVFPGTHDRGILSPQEIQGIGDSQLPVNCLIPPSGGLIMRPLLLHASSKAVKPTNRRIVHPEFAAGNLPGGLEWRDRHALHDPTHQQM